MKTADLEKLKLQFPDYPYPDLIKTIQVSVDNLSDTDRQRYFEFAVFQDDVAIPESALQALWRGDGLNKYDVQDEIYSLVNHSLLRRESDGRLRLHDLQVDYVRSFAGDLTVSYIRNC